MPLSEKRVDEIFQKFGETLDEPDEVFEAWANAQPDSAEIYQLFADIIAPNCNFPQYRELAPDEELPWKHLRNQPEGDRA